MNGWTDKTMRRAMELLGGPPLNIPYHNGLRCRLDIEDGFFWLVDCTCDQQLPLHIAAHSIAEACREELKRRGKYEEHHQRRAPYPVVIRVHGKRFNGDTTADAMIAALEGTQ